MASTQALMATFKKDLLNGIHAFGTTNTRAGTTADTFYGALILDSATLSATSPANGYYGGTFGGAAWSATEVSGTNYTANGAAITNATAPGLTSTTAFWTPSSPLTWTNVTLSTSFSSLFIYNATAGTTTTKPGVGVFTFGATTVSAGNFTINWPTNDSTNALVKIA